MDMNLKVPKTGVKDPIPGVVYMPQQRLQHYVDAGVLPQTTLVEVLMQGFADNADRVALSHPGGEISYGQLDDMTSRLAAALLELGLQPLERVLFQSENSKDLVIALIGCLKAGLIPICTLAAHREREIGYLGRHADARLHVVQGDHPKFDLQNFALRMKSRIPTLLHILAIDGKAKEGVQGMQALIDSQDSKQAAESVMKLPRDPFQAAIFQLSGGTTGVPKIIPRMQNDYLLNAQLTAGHLAFRNDDVMFMPMPMMHNACMICFLLPTLLTGAEFAIPAGMQPEDWAQVFNKRRPTWIGAIRALLPRLDAMLDDGMASLERVRGFWSPDAAGLVRQKYDIQPYALFGMTEGMNMYTSADDPTEAQDTTVGNPLSDFDEIRLVRPGTNQPVPDGETGELTCRGPYTLCGYYNAPERNSETFDDDGFYRSGDLMVRKQIKGGWYYTFAGRTKDVVDRGTEKINCEEVENVVAAHPAVADCALVGMPDPVLGERGCIFMVLKPGREAPTVASLGEYLQDRGLAKFKWPERIEAVEALAVTKVGKLDKAAMRDVITEKLKQEDDGAS